MDHARRLFMMRSFLRRISGRVASGAMLALALSTVPALAASPSTRHTAKSSWLTWSASKHTASLTLIASYNNALSGYNYDGYGNGKMTVTVPVGAHVKVTFSNKNAVLAHSFVITAYANHSSTSSFPLAFKGAGSSNPTTGTSKGKTEHVSFTASKVGKYAIVCPVPGHAPAGMWDVFQVVKSGAAKVSFK